MFVYVRIDASQKFNVQRSTRTTMCHSDTYYRTSHELVWPYVFNASLKPLRNKFGACAGCKALPPEGKAFKQCAGCKAALYCSKECQREDWRSHR